MIMDCKGLVDAATRLDVGGKRSCTKCSLRAVHSVPLQKSVCAFYKQHAGMSAMLAYHDSQLGDRIPAILRHVAATCLTLNPVVRI